MAGLNAICSGRGNSQFPIHCLTAADCQCGSLAIGLAILFPCLPAWGNSSGDMLANCDASLAESEMLPDVWSAHA